MLLSRIFSLMLGTTLFVMIWTMQDGNHSSPRMEMAVPVQPSPQVSALHETTLAPTPEVVVQAPAPESATTEPAMWIFADEPGTQIAVK